MGESVLEVNKKQGFLPNISSCISMTSSEARMTDRTEREQKNRMRKSKEEVKG